MTFLVKIKLAWNSEGHGHGHPYRYIIFILLEIDFLGDYEILIGWFSRKYNFSKFSSALILEHENIEIEIFTLEFQKFSIKNANFIKRNSLFLKHKTPRK